MTMDLAAGAWRMTLRPTQGGVIARLGHGGAPVLRPMDDDRNGPLESACFPLVPYANRIAGGRFRVHGRQHRVPLNFGDHPHSLHGLGWLSSWDVVDATLATATLSHHHDGSAAWPWRYRAVQHFDLNEQGLEVKLTVCNEEKEQVPCGLGFHPYFFSGPATRLRFGAERLWHCDATLLPTRPDCATSLGDWSSGALVAGDVLIDNSYENWSGTAHIEHGDGRAYRLSATGAPWLHLYRPPGASFVCAEPVSHGPDAINRGGMPMLAAGEAQHLAMKIALA